MPRDPTCETRYLGVPFALARSEEAALDLLLACILSGSADKVLVSGGLADRAIWLAGERIEPVRRAGWSVEARQSSSGDDTLAVLHGFASAICGDPGQKRVLFCPAHPKEYLPAMLDRLEVGCSLAVYMLGLDRDLRGIAMGCKGVLNQWQARHAGASTELNYIVSTEDSLLLFDTRREMNDAFDRGDCPSDLLHAEIVAIVRAAER